MTAGDDVPDRGLVLEPELRIRSTTGPVNDLQSR
jgi:hypothetical protein